MAGITDRPICLAGRGSIGTRHLENLLHLGCRNIVAYSDEVDREKDHAFETKYGMKTLHRRREVEELRPVAFVIAVPTNRHSEYALWAARQGAHIFMEKPLSDRLDGLSELRAELLRRGLIFHVGNNLRFHPYLRKLKAMLEEGDFGVPYFARFVVGQYLPDWHPSEDYRTGYSARKELGGGVVLTLQHEIDYAQWFFGEPSLIKAVVRKVSDLEMDVEDLATILLETRNGVLVEIHLDYLQRPPLRSLHIQGSRGSVHFRLGMNGSSSTISRASVPGGFWNWGLTSRIRCISMRWPPFSMRSRRGTAPQADSMNPSRFFERA